MSLPSDSIAENPCAIPESIRLVPYSKLKIPAKHCPNVEPDLSTSPSPYFSDMSPSAYFTYMSNMSPSAEFVYITNMSPSAEFIYIHDMSFLAEIIYITVYVILWPGMLRPQTPTTTQKIAS